ncbi:MAG: pyridoxamine 5'-phosphate oxidase [Alphaproteobacteria bacterium]|nr:pyridoxamine 5'-phosphate oxidase [Alphaproteobacteria bacterium]
MNPFTKFSDWLTKACETKAIVEPTSMCLATVDENGCPSARMILLKQFDERGFCFFTNLTSRKGKELTHNQNVALCFYWGVLGRQIRIEGKVERVSLEEADEYFASRRRGSQIGAWASKQSYEMKEWSEFEERIKKISEDFRDQEIPRPPFWSGFRVIPKRIEFWEEGEFRIHKREVFERAGSGWEVKKIYP